MLFRTANIPTLAPIPNAKLRMVARASSGRRRTSRHARITSALAPDKIALGLDEDDALRLHVRVKHAAFKELGWWHVEYIALSVDDPQMPSRPCSSYIILTVTICVSAVA